MTGQALEGSWMQGSASLPLRLTRSTATAAKLPTRPQTPLGPFPYVKPPFAGPEAVLAYCYLEQPSPPVREDRGYVPLHKLPYGRCRPPADDDDLRRRVHPSLPTPRLPKGFHRIRHYGLLAGGTRKAHLDHARPLLGVAPPAPDDPKVVRPEVCPPWPCCGWNAGGLYRALI